jgi:hypothetical protein
MNAVVVRPCPGEIAGQRSMEVRTMLAKNLGRVADILFLSVKIPPIY